MLLFHFVVSSTALFPWPTRGSQRLHRQRQKVSLAVTDVSMFPLMTSRDSSRPSLVIAKFTSNVDFHLCHHQRFLFLPLPTSQTSHQRFRGTLRGHHWRVKDVTGILGEVVRGHRGSFKEASVMNNLYVPTHMQVVLARFYRSLVRR